VIVIHNTKVIGVFKRRTWPEIRR